MKIKYLICACAFASAPAFAVNVNVFKDAPISSLKPEEVKVFIDTIRKTLDASPDGSTVEWKAPQTGFTSKITPLKSFSQDQRKCRDATIESETHNRFQRGTYTFCKRDGAQWQLASAGTPAKKR